jgi:antitoxin VapB
MMSRLFRSGNSQALRIPEELSFPADMKEVEIEKHGDTLVVRPMRRAALTGALQKFAAFPAGFMDEGRPEGTEQARLDA